MLEARRREKDGKVFTQTLCEHSCEVAEMARSVCAAIGCPTVGALLGFTHDGGKALPLWQAYLESGGRAAAVGHSLPGAAFLTALAAGHSGPGPARLGQMLALAIHGHHGGLRDVLQPDGARGAPDYAAEPALDPHGRDAFWAEVAGKEELDALFTQAEKEEEALDRRLRVAAKRVCSDKQSYLDAYQVFRGQSERFLYSALIDADRYDAARWEDGRRRGDWRRPVPDWEAMGKALRRSTDAIPATGAIPQLRRQIAERFRTYDTAAHGVYRAFVPTGGGKTLSAMALSLRMAEKYQKNHIYFIEPFLTILEQNAADVREKCGAGDAVFEHHSNVLFEDDESGEKLTAYQKRSERWDAPVIFTSLVQFLDALWSGRSAAARRMCALANSVIIIDEVQAVPLSSQYLFNLGVAFLAGFCGCIVVLCTATPPALERLRHPLCFEQDIVPMSAALDNAFRRTDIDVSLTVGRPREPEELADFLTARQAAEGSVLAIMNTKALAKRLFDETRRRLPKGVRIYYLSTSLCPAHRTQRLDEIRALLAAGTPVVCISTQLIEAGVNLSFNSVIRALAGLDAIIQAAGRCNRHGENGRRTVWVVKCAGEERALAFLPEIRIGQLAAERVIRETQAGLYGGDLQSPAAVAAYYCYYYADGNSRGSMAYPIMAAGRGACSAVELLGMNTAAREEYQKSGGVPLPPDRLAQSFRTAGEAYHPIPEDTAGVLIQWGEGEELVRQLRAEHDPQKRAGLLRRAQRFSVSLFRHELRRLLEIGAAAADRDLGIYILDKGRYNDTLGIVFDENESVESYMS